MMRLSTKRESAFRRKGHRRTGAPLSTVQQRYDAIFDASTEGIIELDRDGTIAFANPAARRMTGWREEDLTGKPLASTLLRQNPGGTGRAAAQGAVLSVLRSGHVLHSEEDVLLRRDGTPLAVACTSAPLRDERGRVTGSLFLFTDITAGKRMHEELVDRQTDLLAFLNGAPVLMWMIGPDLRAQMFNDSWLQFTGRTLPQEIAHERRGDTIHPQDRRRCLATYQRAFTERAPFEHEYRLRRHDGEYRWLLEVGVPRRDAAGRFHGYIGTCVDHTERKNAEAELAQSERALQKKAAELEQSNRELEQFAYVASHDLQEPLRMISSYVQLLAKRYRDKLNRDAEDFIGYAVDGAARMQTLINDLLAYSRVQRKGRPLAETPAQRAFECACANLRVAITASGARIAADTPLPLVMADETQLVQLFQNLIGNAIKYCRDVEPQINVSAERAGGMWRFAVRDNGIGIEPRYFERIFVIFQRLHTREEYPGTGIGLAVCQRIVQRHGGAIWVESQPGEGSGFYFTLGPAGGSDE